MIIFLSYYHLFAFNDSLNVSITHKMFAIILPGVKSLQIAAKFRSKMSEDESH